jgi:glycosyltransferase involved in cell wall biosynthesis
MKIGVDARSIYSGGTGDRTYFRSILPHLAQMPDNDEYRLYCRESDSDRSDFAASAGFELVSVASRFGWAWPLNAFPARLKKDRVDLIFAQYNLPPLAPCPSVVVIHDVSFLVHPEWFPKRQLRLMNILIPLAARTSTKIITGSEYSKQEMIRTLNLPASKIDVTPYAVAQSFYRRTDAEVENVLAKYGLVPNAYLAGVGLRGPRKNAKVVFKAIASLISEGKWPSGGKLALAGSKLDFELPPDCDVADKCVFLGYVPDDHLPSLYTGALAAVYPSKYEGFGFPVLEAMACGCPVVSSNATSLPEVANDAAMSIDPDDIAAWRSAIEQVLGDGAVRADLTRRGLQRASAFDWKRCAEQTSRVLHSAANE